MRLGLQTIGKHRLEAWAGASSSSRLSLAALLRLSWAAAPRRDSGKAGQAQAEPPRLVFHLSSPPWKNKKNKKNKKDKKHKIN